MRKGMILVAVVTIAVAGPALAETLTSTGMFPAAAREAAMLRSIAVDRLGGRDGQQVGMAIERALGRPDNRGRPWFEMVYGGRRGGGNADGTLSGAVSSGVEDSYYKKPEKRCIGRDADKKCIKEEEVQVNCTRRVANLTADLRIVRSDGRIVYNAAKPLRQEITWCQGQNPSRTAEEMIASMVGEVAEGVRGDTVPRVETYRIRILESNKGVPKDLTKRFKDVVKLTQRNPVQACREWAALNEAVPNHPSIVFNLGLCAESANDLQAALNWYRAAIPLLGRNNDGSEGLNRVQRRMIADGDFARRARGG